MNPLDKSKFLAIIIKVDAELCKGSTADSDSVCLGSNPSSAANGPDTIGAVFFEVWRSLVARFVRDEEVAGSNPVTSTK